MVQITEAQTKNLDSILMFIKELTPEFKYEKITEAFEAILSSPDSIIYLATLQGIEVGFIEAHLIKSLQSSMHIQIRSLFVLEKYRKKRIAYQLVLKVEKWAQLKGAKLSLVQSRIERDIADKFYLKSGYSKIKVQNVYRKMLY